MSSSKVRGCSPTYIRPPPCFSDRIPVEDDLRALQKEEDERSTLATRAMCLNEMNRPQAFERATTTTLEISIQITGCCRNQCIPLPRLIVAPPVSAVRAKILPSHYPEEPGPLLWLDIAAVYPQDASPLMRGGQCALRGSVHSCTRSAKLMHHKSQPCRAKAILLAAAVNGDL